MSEVRFPAGSRHGSAPAERTPQMSTPPITPAEHPAAWPDEAACKAVSQAQLDVDRLATAAGAAGLDDVQQAAEDAVSALEHLGRVLGDHYGADEA